MQTSYTSGARGDGEIQDKLSGFLRLVEGMLELPGYTLTGGEPLAAVKQWDSLAVVEFLALADERFGLLLDFEQVRRCDTFSDLFALISQHDA